MPILTVPSSVTRLTLPPRWRWLAAGGLGLVSATGFEPLGFWPLTLLSLAGLLGGLQAAPRLRTALAFGWWFGLGHFALGLNWIATAFTYQAAMPAWLGWVAVLLVSLYLAVYPAIAAGVAWRFSRGNLTRLVLLFAAAWIVTEWLRATMFTGFAWNPLGVVLVEVSLSQLTPLIGTYGLSAIVVLLAGLVLALVRAGGRHWLLIVPLFLVVAIDINLVDRSAPAPDGLLLRVVQPNIGQDEKWRPGFEAKNFGRLASLSGQPGPEPRLILWPEAAVPEFLEEDPRARRRLAGLLGPRDILLTGGVGLVYDRNGEVVAARNSMFGLDANGRLFERYDKAHLVPYGEYLPMRPILSAIGLSRLAPGDFDFLPGPGPQSFDVPGFGKVGVQICYEIIFSGHVIDSANRPRFLFNPSNDAWFGAWGPPQHLAQARLRAIEEGLPVVRATPTGISAVIDANGRLLASLPWRTAGAIDARLPAAHAPTPFARFGNLLPFVFALVLAAIARPWKRR